MEVRIIAISSSKFLVWPASDRVKNMATDPGVETSANIFQLQA